MDPGLARSALAFLLDTFLPPCCPVCGRVGVKTLCAACRPQLPAVPSPRCPICGLPFAPGSGPDHRCEDCLRQRFSFDQAVSALCYGGAVPALVHRFKYRRDFTVLPLFASLLRKAAPRHWREEVDVVVPGPLHPLRLRERSYNQALLLAPRAFPRLPLDPFVLRRRRPTPPQVGSSALERRRALRRAFAVKRPERVRGKTVLLVDDVLTTGSTVDECARTLRQAGAERVFVLTLARVAARD